MPTNKRAASVLAAARAPPMTVPFAEAITGGLSWPSKMPGPAWGISARECGRGRLLANTSGTVCSECYALRGRYLTGSVSVAHQRRLAALEHPLWPDSMAYLIDAYARGGHFRWFDSGDIQSPDHLDKILWIASRTSATGHWLPTHEPFIVGELVARIPGNLTVRISADLVEDRPTSPTWGLPTSTVHKHPGEPVPSATGRRRDSLECRAYLRGHRCGSCRACWSPRVKNVSYLLNAGLRKQHLSGTAKRSPRLTVLM